MVRSELKILNAESHGYCKEAHSILSSMGNVTSENLDQQSLMKFIDDFDILLVRLGLVVDRSLLKKAGRLKAIVSATTGTDHIDLNTAQQHNIEVLTLKGENDFLSSIPSTAEHTWALLLALIKNLPWAFDHVKQGEWDRQDWRGNNLMGKRLGILGFGRVGRQVARVANAFQMEIITYDVKSVELPGYVIRKKSLSALLKESDVFCIHVPLTEHTEGMIGREQLDSLPPGALVINTARGKIWDEQALINALQKGHLAGVASDVISEEQDQSSRSENPLIQYARNHHNAIVTPHIAGATFESMALTEIFMARKLQGYLHKQGLI